MYWLTDENAGTTGLQDPNPVFPLGSMVQYAPIWCSQRLYRTELLQITRIHCIVIWGYWCLPFTSRTEFFLACPCFLAVCFCFGWFARKIGVIATSCHFRLWKRLGLFESFILLGKLPRKGGGCPVRSWEVQRREWDRIRRLRKELRAKSPWGFESQSMSVCTQVA